MKRPAFLTRGWRAGWQAGRRRGLPRSLWERVGDGPGASTAWTQSAAVILGGSGGGVPWPGKGVQGRYSAGWGGGEAGCATVVQSVCSLPAPRSVPLLRHLPSGCGGWFEGLCPGPHHGWVPQLVRRQLSVVRATWHRRAGLCHGPQLGKWLSLMPCDMRVAGKGGLCVRVALCAPRRDMAGCRSPGAIWLGAVWCPRDPDTAQGVWRLACQSCRRAQPRAVRRLRPVTVRFSQGAPPSVCPGVRVAERGSGGMQPGSEGCCPLGATPGRWPLFLPPACLSGPGRLCAGLSPWPSPTVSHATRVAAPALCSAVGGREGGRAARRAPDVLGCWGGLVLLGAGGGVPGQRSMVSGQRVRGAPLPRAPVRRVPPACAHLAATPRVCLRPSWPPGPEVTPFPYVFCCADSLGGGVPRAAGPWPAPEGTLVRRSAPGHSVFAVRGLRLRVAGVGLDSWQLAASPPGLWCHRHLGLAVTCASVCVGAGAAAAAGTSGDSTSGRGRRAGPGAARHWPPRP